MELIYFFSDFPYAIFILENVSKSSGNILFRKPDFYSIVLPRRNIATHI